MAGTTTSTPAREWPVVHVRVEPDTHDRVREFARATRRSLNAAALVLIERGLRAEKEEHSK